MAEETTPSPTSEPDWKAEAEKAFAARDKFKAKLAAAEKQAELAGEERAELERLKAAEADAEEKRALAAGEFETVRKKLLEEKGQADAAREAAEARLAQKVVESAFASAPDLFGPSGLTTLTPEFAYAGMGRHVRFVPGENGTPDGVQVVGIDGEVILGEGGRPASFADGMKALIETWPAKDQILRASQKAGSGSAGGSGEPVQAADRAELAQRAIKGDKAALRALANSRPAGVVTHGRAFEREAAEAAAKS